MRTICARCRRELAAGPGAGPISHGSCRDCAIAALMEDGMAEADARAILDTATRAA